MKVRKRNRPKLRIKLGEGIRGYYHLMSRTVNGEKWFGLREKEYLRKLIWQVAEFSGVRVITYAVMDNHFHVLAEVPPEREVSDEEIVRRFAVLYPEPTPWQPLTAEALAELLAENGVRGQELREELTARMHDVSWLMKTIKQRFAIWFNKPRERFGPVWAERFKSVLVEGDVKALRTVAAYIDLNGVRAGLADDPKDYRFCGYAEAVVGHTEAREGLSVLACGGLAGYRQSLFGIGAAPKEGKAGIDPASAARVIDGEGGELSLPEALGSRCRYLTGSLVIGSRSFISEVLQPQQSRRKRPIRPHPMEGGDWEGLNVFPKMRP